jgi:transposase
MDQGSGRRRRRTYSPQFKSEAVAACRRPGVSIAAMALDRSMNANVLRRWVVEAERGEPKTLVEAEAPAPKEVGGFVPVSLPAPVCDEGPVRIEVRRGPLTVSVQWPRSALHECAMWLREVLK